MFCLFTSVKYFNVLLKALEKCPKSGVYQLEIKNLKSEYTILKQLRTPCDMGLPFLGVILFLYFFNVKPKSGKGTHYRNIV